MSTIIIRSNLDTVSNVLIRDLGILIPPGGGSETFTDETNYDLVRASQNLQTLASDGVFPGGADPSDNTLILNDGVNDIAPGDLEGFFAVGPMVGATPVLDGQQGLVPKPLAGDDTRFLRGDGTWAVAGGSITVKEIDGTPTVFPTTIIRVPNGALTDDGGGQVTLTLDPDYAGRFESATIGTGDIATNKWGWWFNTTVSKLFAVRNRAGTLYAVEANPL